MNDHSLLHYFESIADQRDIWKDKNKYYWKDIETFCASLIPEHASVLEIGCGTGDQLAAFKTKKKIGIDFCPQMIGIAQKKHPEMDFRVMTAEDLYFDQKFDYIVLTNIIGYLNDIQAVFSNLKRISIPSTRIIVIYFNFLWQPLLQLGEISGLRMKQPVQNWLSRVEIKNLLYLAGFDAFKEGARMLFPINMPYVSRILNLYFAKLPLIRKLCLTNYVIAKPLIQELSELSETMYPVSVVIPVRNESGNIESAIQRTPRMGSYTELIFIEGNSTDDSWEKIQEMAAKYRDTHSIRIARQNGKGKGDAVRMGFEMAIGDILMILDADLTVPPEDLPKFYDAIVSGKGEFINGSRLVYNMDARAMRFLNLLANKFFSLMFTWLLDQRFKDTLCGTKVLYKSDYERIKAGRYFFGEFDPFGDFDLIFGASKLNLKIVEVPIRYRERVYGSTNIDRFKHGLLLLRMCLFASTKIKFI